MTELELILGGDEGREPVRVCPCVDDPFPPGAGFGKPACGWCGGAGVLDQFDEPFRPPPPFDTWTPRKLVELAASSRARKGEPNMTTEPLDPAEEVPAKPPRLTQAETIRGLIAALAKSATKHSACTITRGQRGTVGWELTAATGEDGIDTLADAVAAVLAEHDRLKVELAAELEEPGPAGGAA